MSEPPGTLGAYPGLPRDCFTSTELFSKICSELKIRRGTLHEDDFTFMTISRSVLLKMRNVLDKRCRENQNTHLKLNKFFPENLAVYEII
jgi:hypothetical protein